MNTNQNPNTFVPTWNGYRSINLTVRNNERARKTAIAAGRRYAIQVWWDSYGIIDTATGNQIKCANPFKLEEMRARYESEVK
jgi:hypothetical protein